MSIMYRLDGWKCKTHLTFVSIPKPNSSLTPEKKQEMHRQSAISSAMAVDRPFEECSFEEVLTKLECNKCGNDLTDEGIKFAWALFDEGEFDERVARYVE